MSDGGPDSTLGKVILSLAVIVAAVPGLVVEPGPLTELTALGALAWIWGAEDFADVI